MPSIRERIIQQRMEALETSPEKLAGLRVHRARTRPHHSDKLPAVVIYIAPSKDGGEKVQRQDHGDDVERSVLLSVECRTAGDPPDEVLDPIVTWVESVFLSDRSAGGIARDTELQAIQWDAEAADKVFGAARLDFLHTYETPEGVAEGA